MPLVVVAAGVAAYANSLHGPFIFDDARSIAEDPAIRHLWPPWAPLKGATRPTSAWTFAVNYALGGLRVEGYHVVNLLIHLSAALVLWGVARRTLKAYFVTVHGDCPNFRGEVRENGTVPLRPVWLALAIALLWVVHPLQTQAVTYVVQREESLMGLFYLLTLYGFLRAQDSRRPGWWYAASAGCCALGMGAKKVMVTAPLMVLWYDRALVAGSWREIFRRRWIYWRRWHARSDGAGRLRCSPA